LRHEPDWQLLQYLQQFKLKVCGLLESDFDKAVKELGKKGVEE